jgi:ketosteroid isomerase-like protein
VTRTARETADLLLERLAALDMAGFADLFAEDGVLHYPFGFPGAPSSVRGRDTIREHLVESRRGVDTLISVTDIEATVYESTDPEVIIWETVVSGTRAATGEPFRFVSGVGVVTVRDGEVAAMRDYTNVLGAAEATGVEGLAGALSRQ